LIIYKVVHFNLPALVMFADLLDHKCVADRLVK